MVESEIYKTIVDERYKATYTLTSRGVNLHRFILILSYPISYISLSYAI